MEANGGEPEPEPSKAELRRRKKAEASEQEGVGELGLNKDLNDRTDTEIMELLARFRSVTGVLASNFSNADVKIASFSLTMNGQPFVNDTELELNQACRYGLIGANGSGKTNLICTIAMREIPIPDHVDLFHLHAEASPTDLSAVEAVIGHVNNEIERLEALSDRIMDEFGPEDERLTLIGDRLDELDPKYFEINARKVLSGLGFADHL
eukprot:SAG11_NODE_6358_length_1329_cov_1.323577_2_plen_208_part_01